MTRRSRAREVALQLLFQHDHNAALPHSDIEAFARARLKHPELLAFCLRLYDGVLAHQADIDKRLAAAAENWRVARMTTVDRNLLRIGAFEILHPTEDTPAPVAFDEAIELARRFGTSDSSAFVNGVLDRLRREALGVSEPPSAQPPSA